MNRKKLTLATIQSIAILLFADINTEATTAIDIKKKSLDTASKELFVCDWDERIKEYTVKARDFANENIYSSDYDDFWIGDSRTVGLDMFKDIDYIGEVGCGINFFKENEEYIYSLKNKDVIIGLGVNDLDYIQSYINLYNSFDAEFLANNNIYVLSVNPCDGSYSELNVRIEDFNDKIKSSLPLEITYIDTYKHLIEHGYFTTDGLHYTKQTYLDIYDYVTDNT